LNVSLRIDDIGSSTKQYEVYSKIPGGNILFFKYIKPFKAWGRYRELNQYEWIQIFEILDQFNAKLTVGITATWVEKDSSLIPFNKKFPDEANILKQGLKNGCIEIANHGLTHCVVGKHLPRMFHSNRTFHREFWDWLPHNVHYDHLKQSQDILQNFFNTDIVSFIPPGNVFCDATVEAAKLCNFSIINCNINKKINKKISNIRIIGNEKIIAFHDRELVLYGTNWLKKLLFQLDGNTTCNSFIKDL